MKKSLPLANLAVYLTPGLTPILNVSWVLLIIKDLSIVWWVVLWGLGTLLIGWASTKAELPATDHAQAALWLLGLSMGLPLLFFFIVPTPIEGTGYPDFEAGFTGLALTFLGLGINMIGGLIAIGWGIWQLYRFCRV